MKQTRLMKLLAVTAGSALALSSAFAQTTKETTTSVGAGGVSTTTSTSTMDGSGVITTYSPGSDYIMLRGEAGEPTRYYYSKSTTVVDPTGATVDMKLLRPDLPVKYTYMKEGDRMVISKITVEKPLTEITKETTTTTTTEKH
ncbi:MAG: hypothetical protein M3R59_03345 [Verrucomicrobiota bacterium]|nr:hypothetical protein [Verrucomicrobiota bacterium]